MTAWLLGRHAIVGLNYGAPGQAARIAAQARREAGARPSPAQPARPSPSTHRSRIVTGRAGRAESGRYEPTTAAGSHRAPSWPAQQEPQAAPVASQTRQPQLRRLRLSAARVHGGSPPGPRPAYSGAKGVQACPDSRGRRRRPCQPAAGERTVGGRHRRDLRDLDHPRATPAQTRRTAPRLPAPVHHRSNPRHRSEPSPATRARPARADPRRQGSRSAAVPRREGLADQLPGRPARHDHPHDRRHPQPRTPKDLHCPGPQGPAPHRAPPRQHSG